MALLFYVNETLKKNRFQTSFSELSLKMSVSISLTLFFSSALCEIQTFVSHFHRRFSLLRDDIEHLRQRSVGAIHSKQLTE